MKNYTRPNQTQIVATKANSVEAAMGCIGEVDLFVEELEQVIAPRTSAGGAGAEHR